MAETTVAERVDASSAAAVSDDVPESVERRSFAEWSRTRSLPQLIVSAVIVLYVSYFTQRTLDIHHGLGTASYDSALYDQGMWLLSRGDAPFVTLMGRNMFGDHTSFVLLFLVPFYWIAPGAWIMFFAQSAAIGAGAIPIFLYARKRLGSEWLALVPAIGFLLHPAVGFTNLENFHPDAFLAAFVPFAMYGALERKWKLYAVFVVLALLVKEDVSLVLVPLGVWVALRRDRRIGIVTVVGSLWFMFTAMFVVMRSLIDVPTRNTWRIPFGGGSSNLGGAAVNLAKKTLTDPTEVANHLRSENRPWYLWQMTAPFAWLFLRLPSLALVSGLVLFTNILSTFWYQYQIDFHYGLVAVPALSMGTVYAIGAIRERVDVLRIDEIAGEGEIPGESEIAGESKRTDRVHRADRQLWVPTRKLAVQVLAVSTLVTAFLWSPVPWGRTSLWHGNPSSPGAVALRDVIAEIPADASVAAHYRVTPHTAYRTEIYQFPNPFRVELYGANDDLAGTRLDARAEGVDFVVLPTTLDTGIAADWEAIQPAFDVAASNDYWVLYQRDPTTPLPLNAVVGG